MVEGCDELDGLVEQHAVAEHVARHVADARDRERRGADVDVHFAEMPPHRLPGAARRDAHLLMVVAGRAAGREGVAEPEIVLDRNRVGDVGKRRGAFVGRHHQIRIVGVVPHQSGRRDHAGRSEIVGDVEQARHEQHVGRHGFLLDRLARAADRQMLRQEAALGADRNDHGVLDLLSLDEAEHLGAEVLRPIGPPDAAARDLAEPQVNALDPRRVDEHLVERPRQRQAIDLAALELDRDGGLRRPARFELIEIGAQRRPDRVDEVAQDAVLVEAFDVRQRGLDLGGTRGLARRAVLALTVEPRIEADVKELNDVGRDA